MGIFKRLFSKQEPEPTQDFNSAVLEDLKAYIVMGADSSGECFVSCEFAETGQQNMAELLALLYSGAIVEDCIESLRMACGSDIEATLILHRAAELIQQDTEAELKEQQQDPISPVIDPCAVFGGDNKNDLKG